VTARRRRAAAALRKARHAGPALRPLRHAAWQRPDARRTHACTHTPTAAAAAGARAPVEVCEALDVQHVHLVDEQHARHELRDTCMRGCVFCARRVACVGRERVGCTVQACAMHAAPSLGWPAISNAGAPSLCARALCCHPRTLPLCLTLVNVTVDHTVDFLPQLVRDLRLLGLEHLAHHTA
jgi:hypothetical protein